MDSCVHVEIYLKIAVVSLLQAFACEEEAPPEKIKMVKSFDGLNLFGQWTQWLPPSKFKCRMKTQNVYTTHDMAGPQRQPGYSHLHI